MAVRIEPWRGSAKEAAAFLAPLNRRPEHHILFLDTDEGAVERSLADLTPPIHEGFQAAWDGDSLIGMLGVEWDPEPGQAWLFGPFVASGDWHRIADRLLGAVVPILPESITQLDLGGDTRHERLPPFADRQGFTLYRNVLIMNLPRSRFRGESHPDVVPYRAELASSLAALHDRSFPGTYFRGNQLARLDPGEYPILVVEDAGRVAGYTMLEPDPASGTAFLHFVAVTEEARGKGVGRRLLDSILAQAFANPAVREVSLTVDVENTGPATWYSRMNFATERTVVAFRRPVHRF